MKSPFVYLCALCAAFGLLPVVLLAALAYHDLDQRPGGLSRWLPSHGAASGRPQQDRARSAPSPRPQAN